MFKSKNNDTVVQQEPGKDAEGAIVKQPTPSETSHLVSDEREWSSGLCQCTHDWPSCLLTTFCYPFYLMHLYGRHHENCCLPCFLVEGSMALRSKHRFRHHIEGSLCDDCLAGVFCGPCTVCQLKRDMDFVEEKGHKL